MSAFMGLLNRTITVNGLTSSGEDGGGNPTYTSASKGTVKGRVDPKVRPDELNGADLNPIVSDYLAITQIPVGFYINERDTLATGSITYEVLGIAVIDDRSVPHHLEMDLRRVTA